MTTHNTPHAAPPPEQAEAEPTRRASRQDQRGIALQTVIIMVVLLAIAGGVAAVLLARGQEAQEQLEEQAISTRYPVLYKTEAQCDAAGFEWDAGGCETATVDATHSKTECLNNGHEWDPAKTAGTDACVDND